jgi:hypothetical protein
MLNRSIFGTKVDTETGGWRNLHNEELHNFYSPSIIRVINSRRMRWALHVPRMWTRGIHIGYLWDSQIEKNTLDRHRRRWVDNIKMAHTEIGLD